VLRRRPHFRRRLTLDILPGPLTMLSRGADVASSAFKGAELIVRTTMRMAALPVTAVARTRSNGNLEAMEAAAATASPAAMTSRQAKGASRRGRVHQQRKGSDRAASAGVAALALPPAAVAAQAKPHAAPDFAAERFAVGMGLQASML